MLPLLPSCLSRDDGTLRPHTTATPCRAAFEQWSAAWPLLEQLGDTLIKAGLPPLPLLPAKDGRPAVTKVKQS